MKYSTMIDHTGKLYVIILAIVSVSLTAFILGYFLARSIFG
jgi:uncharacterized protein YneF (UPF0154 family)